MRNTPIAIIDLVLEEIYREWLNSVPASYSVMQKQISFIIAAAVLLAAFVTVALNTISSANAQGNATTASGAAMNMTNSTGGTAKNMTGAVMGSAKSTAGGK